MKHLKTLGLATVAAMAAMAFVGATSASAGHLCTGTPASHCGTPMVAGETFDMSIETSSLMKTTGGTTVATCSTGSLGGQLANTGSTTETVKETLTAVTWGGCTTTVDTLSTGTLEFHHIAGTDNATVTSSGLEVTIQFLGVSCLFKTNNTDIGVLTGGNPATTDINGTIPATSPGGFLCPPHIVWSGAYEVGWPSGTVHSNIG